MEGVFYSTRMMSKTKRKNNSKDAQNIIKKFDAKQSIRN